MLETIHVLRNRLEELEHLTVPDPTRIYLSPPYASGSQGSQSPDLADLDFLNLTQRTSPTNINMPEPPTDLIASLLDMFLERFVNSGYFFLRPSQFRESALLILPFGHQDRPSPALLTAVYLWGSVLCGVTPNDTYTPDSFLACVLQNIPQDLARMDGNPQLVVETIQAEVLLSLYFLHIADPVRGRYHASAAASIAFGADLHLIRSPQHHPIYPPFTLHAPLPPEQNTAEESIRIGAFWAAIIVNNLWAGVAGSPSPIPYTINVDSPWPSSSYAGATITKFFDGNDAHGSSSMALLTKASLLLERIIAFSARTAGPPDPTSLASLDHRLHTFQVSLPPVPGMHILLLTHALVDLAIIRLHAPYMRTSDSARSKCLTAAARIVVGVGAVSNPDGARNTDPMFGPIFAGVASVYMDELQALAPHSGRRAQVEAREIEMRLGRLMSAMASLAAYSPLIAAYATKYVAVGIAARVSSEG
ncbi:hypothetical protein DFH08DRAFT_1055255 [Mycena albidolilacea]|uniref:Transcription factor domain-containing protein n=1 Tax=Mycena albidolilacea TaxID=1033008 RepID=A0AAD7EA83_9AGAR|nr:hypothetical protein DFH08DRAFT_1055255 [Mycena albidolilacea]